MLKCSPGLYYQNEIYQNNMAKLYDYDKWKTEKD